MNPYEGILLCNKPPGLSSHDVVMSIRRNINNRKIGHTGTLDPNATGLMVLCLGRATKIVQFLSGADKTYEARICLGMRSKTYDSEGIIVGVESNEIPHLTEEDMEKVLIEFKGKTIQRVPAFSAVKINGERLYKKARQGQEVELPEREIFVSSIKLTGLDLPEIRLEISCSKGTYIRSIANDIGEKIGCGAYLSGLNRIRVDNFSLEDALTINEIKHYHQAGVLKKYIKPIESVLDFPSIKVNETFSSQIITGRSPRMKDIVDIEGNFNAEEYISLRDYTGRIMAVGKADISSSELEGFKGKHFFSYVRVLN